ncbi:hypothetical protein FRC08_009675 [Ceratobasidium sp. 394]|nr:hypothetical protein FRC08_009675 [Ceratobasidium sp. 394]
MSIPSGTYLIVSVTRPDYSVMMFGDHKEGIPIPAAPLHSWPQEHFMLEQAGDESNRYTVMNTHYQWYIGADVDNIQEFNYPSTSFRPFEWSIEPAGGDTFKIHIPNMDAYWNLPESDREQIRIIVEPTQGRDSELWRLQKIG